MGKELEMARLAVKALDEKKGKDIQVIDCISPRIPKLNIFSFSNPSNAHGSISIILEGRFKYSKFFSSLKVQAFILLILILA